MVGTIFNSDISLKSMIIVKNLNKEIAGDTLFEEASFVLHRGDKVGLVGPNGCGKSILLKIIVGEVESDGGGVDVGKERVGYLPQDPMFQEDDTVESFLSFSENPKAKEMLEKVDLANIAHSHKVSDLSGGQKTRLSLARVLLSRPSVLLLDEPTNHLDTSGLRWLEKFIEEFRGGVLIVSHDRKLLDNSITKIFEIDPVNSKLVEYAGGYTDYMEEKKRMLVKLEGDYRRQQNEKKRMKLWLARKRQEASVYDDPSKGKMIKAMEKRMQREIYDNEIKRPGSYGKISKLQLQGEAASSKLIVRGSDICKSFSGKTVLKGISLEIRGDEHVLLSGKNGSGKTTLFKIITRELEPDSGKLRMGDGVNIGYFSQEHDVLDMDSTVLEEFGKTHAASRDSRSALGSFLFSGNDVFKKVSDLSLGERVRLIFAKLTNERYELLILDEPTNHLDIQSKEIIENALLDYEGAIFVVSHDRYFLEKISIDRRLMIYNGTIVEDFM